MYAVEIYHPYFGWLCWEEGDTAYSTREAAVEAAKGVEC